MFAIILFQGLEMRWTRLLMVDGGEMKEVMYRMPQSQGIQNLDRIPDLSQGRMKVVLLLDLRHQEETSMNDLNRVAHLQMELKLLQS